MQYLRLHPSLDAPRRVGVSERMQVYPAVNRFVDDIVFLKHPCKLRVDLISCDQLFLPHEDLTGLLILNTVFQDISDLFTHRQLSRTCLRLSGFAEDRPALFAAGDGLVNYDRIEGKVDVLDLQSVDLSHSHARQHGDQHLFAVVDVLRGQHLIQPFLLFHCRRPDLLRFLSGSGLLDVIHRILGDNLPLHRFLEGRLEHLMQLIDGRLRIPDLLEHEILELHDRRRLQRRIVDRIQPFQRCQVPIVGTVLDLIHIIRFVDHLLCQMVDRDLALIRESTGMDAVFNLLDFVCDFLTRFAVNGLALRSAVLFKADTDLTLPVLLVLHIVDCMASVCVSCFLTRHFLTPLIIFSIQLLSGKFFFNNLIWLSSSEHIRFKFEINNV